MINELCPDGVLHKSFFDIIERVKEKAKEKSKNIPVYVVSNKMGLVPFEVYRGEDTSAKPSEDTSNYTIVRKGQFAYNPARLNVGSLALMEDKECLISPMYVAFKLREGIEMNHKFVLHFLKSSYVLHMIESYKEAGARFRFDFTNWKKIQIPIPPIEIQNEIVSLLDSLMLSKEEIKKELEYEILSRKKHFTQTREDAIDKCEGKMVFIGDECDVFTGGEAPDNVSKAPDYENGKIYAVWANGRDVYGYTDTYRIEPDAVCISSIGANTGAVYFHQGKFTPIIRLKVLVPKETTKIDIHYLYHAVSVIDFTDRKVSSVPNMNANEIKSKKFKLPILPEQLRIASLLNELEEATDTICSELNNEIELRQKQYEYYRDKLLTFKELKA